MMMTLAKAKHIYSTGITYNRQNIFRVQATEGQCHKTFCFCNLYQMLIKFCPSLIFSNISEWRHSGAQFKW
jgi:hypothetical protein